jgi:hypothetical protein
VFDADQFEIARRHNAGNAATEVMLHRFDLTADVWTASGLVLMARSLRLRWWLQKRLQSSMVLSNYIAVVQADLPGVPT